MQRILEPLEMSRHTDAPVVEQIIETYRGYVYNLLYQLTGHRDLADDLTQETLLRIWKHIGTYRGDANIKTWIGKIAINVYRSHMRRGLPMAEYPMVETTMLPDWSSNPERIVVKRELNSCIRHVLNYHLSESQRMVLTLRDLHGFSYQEISAVLGISIQAVKSRLHRARTAFRNHLLTGGCAGLLQQYLCVCEGVKEL